MNVVSESESESEYRRVYFLHFLITNSNNFSTREKQIKKKIIHLEKVFDLAQLN